VCVRILHDIESQHPTEQGHIKGAEAGEEAPLLRSIGAPTSSLAPACHDFVRRKDPADDNNDDPVRVASIKGGCRLWAVLASNSDAATRLSVIDGRARVVLRWMR